MSRFIQNALTNWKTTIAGLGMIVGGVVHLIYGIHAHGLTESDCTTTVLSILTGAGLLAAGDAGIAPPTSGGPTDKQQGS